MRRLVVVLLSCCLITPLTAQEFDFYARGPYKSAVPRPEALLGYRVGSQQTMYHQQQQVLDQLIAAAPERVRTEVIGKTAEGKVMRGQSKPDGKPATIASAEPHLAVEETAQAGTPAQTGASATAGTSGTTEPDEDTAEVEAPPSEPVQK